MKPLNRLWNLPIKNPTQTAYTRFMRGPESGIRSAFSDAEAAFTRDMENRLKTPYDELWRDGGTR